MKKYKLYLKVWVQCLTWTIGFRATNTISLLFFALHSLSCIIVSPMIAFALVYRDNLYKKIDFNKIESLPWLFDGSEPERPLK